MELCKEVFLHCKKYNGLLSEENATTQQLREWIKESEVFIIQKVESSFSILSDSERPLELLFFHSKYILEKIQLAVHFTKENEKIKDEDKRLKCVVLFRIVQNRLEFTHLCPIESSIWNNARVYDSQFKIFVLGQDITQISLTQEEHTNEKIHNNEDNNNNNQSELNISIEENIGYHLFWMTDFFVIPKGQRGHITCVETIGLNSHFQQYIQFIIDVHLFNTHYKRNDLLRKELIQYYKNRNIDLYYHSDMMILFMYATVRVFVQKKIVDNATVSNFFKLWSGAELFLFENILSCNIENQVSQLLQHIEFYDEYGLPPSHWFKYVVNGESNKFWELTQDEKYKIKFEWLLNEDFVRQGTGNIRVSDGYAYIDRRTFRYSFVPCLYRCTLKDVLVYLLYSEKRESLFLDMANENQRVFYNLLYRYHYSVTEIEEICFEVLRVDLKRLRHVHDLCFHYGHIVTPVFIKLMEERSEFDCSQNEYEEETREPTPIIREEMPDLEDLFKSDILPPCLRNLYTPPRHMGHYDRVNAVRYLIGLSYEEDESVSALCKNSDNSPSYVADITNQFRSFSKSGNYTKEGTLGCSSIINLYQGEKNSFRCVYEAQKNGNNRVKSSYDEKKSFINECCSKNFGNNTNNTMSHPLQFVHMKFRK